MSPSSTSSTTATITPKVEDEDVDMEPSAPQNVVQGRFHCNYCERDISAEVRIKCAECKDFDLCLDCFYVGVETAHHVNTHSYRVMDDMSASIYTSKWGADEELLLLEGIELFGLGNWGDISEHVGTKNKFECEYHYWSIYIDVPTFPLPDTSHGILEDREIGEKDVKKDDFGLVLAISEQIGRTPHDLPSRKNKHKIKGRDKAAYAELSYLPLRGDFAVEFDDKAEDRLSHLEITEKDSPQERDLKLRVLRAYDLRLQERIRRKEFAIERGIVDFRKVQAHEKKMSKEDRELHFKYRPFSRFIEQEEFDELMQGVIRERNLQSRIEQLKHYRMMGITSLEEAERYEHERKKREADVDSRRSRRGVSHRARKGSDEPFATPITPTGSMIGQAPERMDSSLLSGKERELCTSLRLHPSQYTVVKDALVRESFRLGYLTKNTAFKLLEGAMDQANASKLYDYLVLAGWVKNK